MHFDIQTTVIHLKSYLKQELKLDKLWELQHLHSPDEEIQGLRRPPPAHLRLRLPPRRLRGPTCRQTDYPCPDQPKSRNFARRPGLVQARRRARETEKGEGVLLPGGAAPRAAAAPCPRRPRDPRATACAGGGRGAARGGEHRPTAGCSSPFSFSFFFAFLLMEEREREKMMGWGDILFDE